MKFEEKHFGILKKKYSPKNESLKKSEELQSKIPHKKKFMDQLNNIDKQYLQLKQKENFYYRS